MLSRLRSYRPRHATAVAYLALFVALGGTSYGVATGSIDGREIKNNTVRSKDIRNNAIRGRDVRTATLRSSDVADHSLLARDFAPGQPSAGAPGPQGPQGPRGPAGQSGVIIDTTGGGDEVVPDGEERFVRGLCRAGFWPTGGWASAHSLGGDGANVTNQVVTLQGFDSSFPFGWFAQVVNNTGEDVHVNVHVNCINARQLGG